jgi:phosphonate transport system substrate-binding protein
MPFTRREFTTLMAAIGASAALPAMADEKSDPQTLRVALLPDENSATIIQNAQPLKDYLAERLGKTIEIIVTTDYSSMIEAMRFGRIEVGYFGPLSYVLAKSKAPEIEPFAVGVIDGTPTYRSILIAGKDGPVTSLEDVRGQPFAFGDQASTSSHLAPRTVLSKAGLTAGEDYEAVYLGQHDAVARAVAAGQVPAGGLSESIYETLVERGSVDGHKLRVLGYSDPLPNYPMTLQGYLETDLKERIRTAFLELDDPEILKLFRVERLDQTDDSAYDVLREMARILDLDLSS